MYSLEINQKAESEIDKIGRWYDKRVPGLSFRFYDDLDKCIKNISTRPFAFSYYDVKRKIRKCSLSSFPYKIYYHVSENTIYLLAVIHSKRSSGYTRRHLH